MVRLEVIDNQSGTVIGLRRLYGPDFRSNATYQEFYVDFNYQTVTTCARGMPVIFGVTFQDVADIWLDRIIVTEYPGPYTTSPPYDYFNLRLKVIDGAGNTSSDLLVLPTIHANYSVYLPLIIKPTCQ